MKTKDFIKMLQDADPSGELHVRMQGGIPRFAIRNPGYWDGNYSYIDEDGNWVESEESDKIDIYCQDIDDYVERGFSKDITLEDMKKKFKFKLLGGEERNKETKERIMKMVEESYNDMVKSQNLFTKK